MSSSSKLLLEVLWSTDLVRDIYMYTGTVQSVVAVLRAYSRYGHVRNFPASMRDLVLSHLMYEKAHPPINWLHEDIVRDDVDSLRVHLSTLAFDIPNVIARYHPLALGNDTSTPSTSLLHHAIQCRACACFSFLLDHPWIMLTSRDPALSSRDQVSVLHMMLNEVLSTTRGTFDVGADNADAVRRESSSKLSTMFDILFAYKKHMHQG